MPKSDQYLLIQNHGEAPVEGYTVLGYSSTRNCGVGGVIGQFGSGAKHAVNLCLRNGLAVWVYCGKTRLEFSLQEEVVNDGLKDDTVHHVVYRKGNNAPKRAGWVLDFGVLDWDNIGMAIREFISNAIDRTLREEGGVEDAKNANRLSVKIVDDSDRRAKADFTRIYVALNDEVREYYGHLGRRFLHFSDNPENAKPGIMEKANRNEKGNGAVIYREGVWIAELEDNESNFDYNFSTDQITIDECRNSSSWAIKAACARMLQTAETSTLTTIMKSELAGQETFESDFDNDYMTDFGRLDTTQSARWQEAWDAAAGPGAIVCDNEFSKNYVENKGHAARQVKSHGLEKAMRSAGIRSAMDVLSIDEQRGRTRLDTTEDAQQAVDWAWDLFKTANLVGDREKPEVFCFQAIGSAESTNNGFQNSEGVHLHIDIANAGQNNELRKTALEEVTHWVTGATDSSRDFQNFLLDALVTLA